MEVCNKQTPQKCCKECRSRYNRERYLRRKAGQSAPRTYTRRKSHPRITADTRRNELRRIIYEHYEANPCVECGEARIACLQLDHLRDKVSCVSKMVSVAVAKETLLAEIVKCRVLCANCHAVHTAKQLGWYAWRNKDLLLSHSG